MIRMLEEFSEYTPEKIAYNLQILQDIKTWLAADGRETFEVKTPWKANESLPCKETCELHKSQSPAAYRENG